MGWPGREIKLNQMLSMWQTHQSVNLKQTCMRGWDASLISGEAFKENVTLSTAHHCGASDPRPVCILTAATGTMPKKRENPNKCKYRATCQIRGTFKYGSILYHLLYLIHILLIWKRGNCLLVQIAAWGPHAAHTRPLRGPVCGRLREKLRELQFTSKYNFLQ